MTKKNVFSGCLAVDRAKNGESSDAQLRKDINRANVRWSNLPKALCANLPSMKLVTY